MITMKISSISNEGGQRGGDHDGEAMRGGLIIGNPFFKLFLFSIF